MESGRDVDRSPRVDCLAAIQGAILLIAARRADQISSELAHHTYQVDRQTLDLAEQVAARTEEDLDLTRQVRDLTEHVQQLTLAVHTHLGCEREVRPVSSEQVWLTELQRLGDLD